MSAVVRTTIQVDIGAIDGWYPENPDGCPERSPDCKPCPNSGIPLIRHKPIEFPLSYDFYRSRFYVVPLSVTDRTLVGIVSHFFGRKWWLYPVPIQTTAGTVFMMRFSFYDGLPPMQAGNPRIFKLELSESLWLLKSVAFSTSGNNFYIKANNTNTLLTQGKDQNSGNDSNSDKEADEIGPTVALEDGDMILSKATVDDLCRFKFLYTAGPLVPYVDNQPESFYYVITSQGKALVADNVFPYLSWANLDFSDSQRFLFRPVSVPNIAAPNLPFVFNWHPYLNQSTMYCFDDNNNLDIRTEAGDWEKLVIEMGVETSAYSACRFTITGEAYSGRLRATQGSPGQSTGSVTLVPNGTITLEEDYFYVIPMNPYQ
eukprot:GILI01011267.1.p1 GENE.GILI01011267.1~~GILI01011267.1.p1  ORF type:complete len:383 (+),score=12.32 GILI01011267.1:36-1151(+)